MSLVLFLAIVCLEGSSAIERTVTPFFWSALLLVGWLFVSAAAGKTPVASMLILKEEWLYCIVPIGLYVFRDRAYAQGLLSTLAVSVTIIGIYGVIQHFTGVNLFYHSPSP